MTGVYLLGAGISLFVMYQRKSYSKYAVIVLAGSVAALCIHLAAIYGKEEPVSEIFRAEKSAKRTVLELEAEAAEEGTDFAGKKEETEAGRVLRLEVAPQAYRKEELDALEEEMWSSLEQELAGENPSLEYVTENLNFPETVKGYPFLLTWSSSAPKLLNQNGKLGEDISGQGELVEICTRVTAIEDVTTEKAFEKEHVFYVKVYPSQTQEAFWKRLERYLAEREELSRGEDRYVLPERFEGKTVSFQERKEDKSGPIFLLSVVGAVLLIWARQQEKEKEKKERETEIAKEYPQLAVRMAMLAGTGMTISGAFKRIAEEYGKTRQEKKKPLYEEMQISCREIESGISEMSAYENMGRRCRLPCITRFTALLIQYSKSGSSGLKKALQEEAAQALKERKEYARKRGEEAGTKLLAPMMLMLILVVVVIMIPAFTSFGV